MEIACHSWAFNDLLLPEALGTIARLGFRMVDIGSGPHLNHARAATRPRETADELLNDLTMFNLKLGDVYLMLPRISIADEAKRKQDIDVFKALVPFMRLINAPGVTLSPGLVHPAEDTEAPDRAIAALREMVTTAKAADVPVSIELHMDSMAQDPEAAQKFLKGVPGLTLTLDWAQLVCNNIPHEKIVELLPHTRRIQMRQAARAQLQLPFDRGRIDIEQVMQALRDADYKGDISVEYIQTKSTAHGLVEVNAIQEVTKMRDAIRDVRDKVMVKQG